MAVAQSLGYGLPLPYAGEPLDAYRKLFEPHMLASFWLSLKVGAISACFAVILGVVFAIFLWSLPASLQQAGVIYKIPLVLPHIAVAFIVLILWSKSGVFSSIGYELGLVDTPQDFPSILYGGSGVGMILAYVYKEIPFVLLMAYASLKRLDSRLIDTARMLGAGQWMTFRCVVLPHLMPVVHTTFIILFLYAFGAFEIPFLLGESRPGMLSIEAYNIYFRKDMSHRPEAMAILVAMFLFSIGFIVLYFRIVSRFRQQDRKL